MEKLTNLENKIIQSVAKSDIVEDFVEENTPTEDFYFEEDMLVRGKKKPSSQELPFELSPKDVEIIEIIATKDGIPYHFAVQNVLRDALDLYHKFIKITKE